MNYETYVKKIRKNLNGPLGQDTKDANYKISFSKNKDVSHFIKKMLKLFKTSNKPVIQKCCGNIISWFTK